VEVGGFTDRLPSGNLGVTQTQLSHNGFPMDWCTKWGLCDLVPKCQKPCHIMATGHTQMPIMFDNGRCSFPNANYV
jgi:hypothetical protein